MVLLLTKIRYLIFVLVGIICIFAFLWLFPKWQIRTYLATEPDLKTKTLVELENDTRRTWAQILGGVFFLITAYFTWRRVTATESQVRVAQEQARIAQEGQITERFTRAIEQLGDREHLEVRLGGIYALERIAKDSRDDHWTIMEVLTAYVRENAPRRSEDEQAKGKRKSKGEKSEGSQKTSQPSTDVIKPPADIQAILTVLGRRKVAHEEGEDRRLNLIKTELRGAALPEANLQKANLGGANLKEAILPKANLQIADLEEVDLQKADLGGAKLQGANLGYAYLKEADLSGAGLRNANLQRADLGRAILQGAILLNANFQDADLGEANLGEANLEEANLREAKLSGANLEEAILPKANLQKTWLRGANLHNAFLGGANLQEANLQKANLGYAYLKEADLSGANLQEAIDIEIEQLSEVQTLYEAKLDPELMEQVKKEYPDLLKSPYESKSDDGLV